MDEPIVATRSGQVLGLRIGGVCRFLGVPYAAAPVGERRFQTPQPHETWPEVRDATVPGATAPYTMRPFDALDVTPLIGEGWVRGDDYLNVNVWTPDGSPAGLPVMVFIHGGGFVAGSNQAPVQDGAAFARSGVVLMAINYRMGIDGFLPIDGAPTNLGLRDQLAALRWVQENAAAFGGDASNVTVFGESAGAMSIADLVSSPLAKGLFRRAIIQSGHGSMVRPIEVAQRLTRKLARMLKVTPDVQGFRSRTVDECLAVMDKVQAPTARIDLRDAHGREPAFGLSRFLPVYGDDVVPEPPLDALAKGAGADVDILIGTNLEEMNIYFVPTGVKRKIGRFLSWFLMRGWRPNASAILKAYGMGQRGRRAGDAFTEALHDLVFRLPARRFAAAHRGHTHFYEFGWRSPAFEGELGACHALEIPFVFDTLACATGARGFAGPAPPQALAERIHRLWVGFATDGTLPWPEYDEDRRQVFALEQGASTTDADMPAARYFP
jgi:para-nitrobenzyl esterase